jgi:hypothetical protein
MAETKDDKESKNISELSEDLRTISRDLEGQIGKPASQYMKKDLESFLTRLKDDSKKILELKQSQENAEILKTAGGYAHRVASYAGLARHKIDNASHSKGMSDQKMIDQCSALFKDIKELGSGLETKFEELSKSAAKRKM